MTVKRNIPFSPPDVGEAEIKLVADALRSGWITTGPKTKEFERRIAAFVQNERLNPDGTPAHTVACLNSATAAMELALRVLGVGPGDEVIVPAYTYTSSASVVDHVGARIVFVDAQPGTFEMDYDKMADAITERTKVIIPVDLGGIMCDYDKIFAAVEAKRHLFRPANDVQAGYGRCIVSADGAHAFGAMRNGKMAGTVADFTSYSFHAVKNLTTAEGGALTWLPVPGMTDEEVYKKLQLLSLHGQNKDALAKTRLGAWEYDIIGPWFKCNMTDIMAGIGLAQLERYAAMVDRRHQMIERYNAGLADLPVHLLNHADNTHRSSGHLYLVHVDGIDVEQRNRLIELMAERGVATNVHYKPLPMMTAYKSMGNDIKDYPNAYDYYRNEITLPLHTRLTDDDQEYIIAMFRDSLGELMGCKY